MSKDEVFLDIAQRLGTLSTCDRSDVGAVITFDGRAVSWGYNGAPPGLPHCDENNHGWQAPSEEGYFRGWKASQPHPHMPATGSEGMCELCGMGPDAAVHQMGCRNATHAEANAIAFAARQGVSTVGGTIYVSVSPCLDCSRLIIAAGILQVVYDTIYRDRSGIELLQTAGVECTHLPSTI